MKSFSHFYVWTFQRPARENLFSHTDILRPTHGKIPSSFFLLTTSKNFETHPYPRLTSTSSLLSSLAGLRRWRARQLGDIRHPPRDKMAGSGGAALFHPPRTMAWRRCEVAGRARRSGLGSAGTRSPATATPTRWLDPRSHLFRPTARSAATR